MSGCSSLKLINLITFVEDVAREIGRTKCNILFTTNMNVDQAVMGAAKSNLKVTSVLVAKVNII